MRLIDADEFIKDECNNCDGACESLPCDCLECKADCRCDFIKDLEAAPTIDAEPVVRCKDCEYRSFYGGNAHCYLDGRDAKDEDFCSWGERKDDV